VLGAVSDPRARLRAALPAWDEACWFRAPGRVNLMGDHTDYNEGLVLPLAIDRECVIVARAAERVRVRVRTLDPPAGEPEAVELAADGSDDPAAPAAGWGRYVAGLVRVLAERGRPPAGIDAVLASSVPAGSGLSSSAALEVACALALLDAAGAALPAEELALACQAAEHLATGVQSGIMDQLASAAGEAGAALLIDCRTLARRAVPIPDAVDVLVVHSGESRTLAGTEYADRRRGCEEAAARLGLRSLRDAAPEQVADDPLARHVVSENRRVEETAAALAAGRVDELGPLLDESHRSLRDDYRVSTPALDALVEELRAAGALGARLTGAGFGGCAVALVPAGTAAAVAARAAAAYRARTRREPAAFAVRAAAGAGVLG
jgi:galactokinase